ncbi:MAG: lysostaphin resistance A-like protein [Fidelibacterota bacterium]
MKSPFTARAAFGIVVLSLLLSGFVTSGAILLFQTSLTPRFAAPISLMVGELLLIVPLLVLLTRRTANVRQVLRINSVPLSTVGVTALFSLGVAVWADEIDRIITLLIPPPDWVRDIMQTVRGEDPMSLVLLFCGAVIFAAVAEESLFRGFLQQTLEKHWKDVTRAVLVTSLFFAIIHFNPWLVIQIYLLGVLMGYLAWRTDSVLPSMVFHGINNGLAFAFANWGDHLEAWYTWRGHVSPLVLTGGVALTVIGFRRIADRHHEENGGNSLAKS